MQIKTFRASTVNEALQRVKHELGPDAVILGNKKVTVAPNQSYIEIVAAAEPDRQPPVKAMPTTHAELQVEDDIQEIKSLLSMLISSKGYFTQLQLQEPLTEIYHSLLMRGLDEKHTFILLKKVLSQLENGTFDCKQIISGFGQQLLNKIAFATPFRGQQSSKPLAYAFVGPTGVGKTTTLAKLAAYLKIKRRLKTGIISVDTYRIGAIDQLQTYAQILDIPMIVAQSAADLHQAIAKFNQQDVILIDTIGKNFLQKQHIADLQRVFADSQRIQQFMVLSAAAKDEDIKQTIKHFRSFNIHSLIFTKIDETLTPGSMINQLLRFPHPISYLGTGQRVPEDLEPANRKLLLSLLFPSEKAGNEKD
jgi:flagellar biosynthesis protein FlhF